MNFVLALDQGTTSSRAILFDQPGRIVATAQHEFPQIFPSPGWVEHNPLDILTSQLSASVEFARAVFALGLPMFGSCWGLQLATVAAGGEVRANPRGREIAFARKLTLTQAGRAHPLHAGRPLAFDAPAIHADEVATLPAGATVTATNAMSAVQAAEIRVGASIVWAVQYHPEYNLADVAGVIRRYGQRLVDDGLFAKPADLEAYARDLLTLEAEPARRDIAWRFDIDAELREPAARRREIANWLERQALRRG